MGYYENVPLLLLGFQYVNSHLTIYVAVLSVSDDLRLLTFPEDILGF